MRATLRGCEFRPVEIGNTLFKTEPRRPAVRRSEGKEYEARKESYRMG
jgi:hypothetical protein